MNNWYRDLYLKTAGATFSTFKTNLEEENSITITQDSSEDNPLNDSAYQVTPGSIIPESDIPGNSFLRDVRYRRYDEDDARGFYRSENIEILSVPNSSILDAIEYAKTAIESEDETQRLLYGVLLANGHEKHLNILHPVNAYRISGLDQESLMEKKYTVHLYTVNNNYAGEFRETTLSYENIEPHLVQVVSMIADRVGEQYTIENTNISLGMVDSKLTILYEPVYKNESGEIIEMDPRQRSTFVPTQVVRRPNGLIYPYYGGTLLSNGQGYNVMGHLNANLSKKWEQNSICTGDFDKYTIEGMKTLNQSNEGSVYTSSTYHTGFLDYAFHCIRFSMNLMAEATDGTPRAEPRSEDTVLTRDEYSLAHSNSSLTDYLNYVKEQLGKVQTRQEGESDERISE